MLDGPSLFPSGTVESLVILAHGYGSNGADLIGLAHRWRTLLPSTLFLAPNAPERSPHPGGFQWFAIGSLSPLERQEGTARAAPFLDSYLDAQLAHHKISPSKLALVGFSQGTMLALHVGLRHTPSIAGIVGYSGALAAPQALAAEIRARPPVLLVHGADDPLIPVHAMHQASAVLTANGVVVQTHVSPNLGHSISPQGLEEGGRFLHNLLVG